MRDYEELVRELRGPVHSLDCEFCNRKCCYPDGVFDDKCVIIQAADAIEELQKALDVVNDAHNEGYDVGYWAGWRDYEPKWISVEERLPEDKETCLIWYEYYHYSFERVLPEYGIGFYLSMYDMWYGDPSTGKDVKVLYWMPLPEPPKEEK